MPVIIIPREEWGAVPPTQPPETQILPVQNLVIYPETKTRPCKSKKDCIKRMKKIQKIHMEVWGLPDIKYNFMVGLDGRIYEGTGWSNRGHVTTISDYKEYNNFISICYIGNYAGFRPPMYLLKAADKLIKYGIDENYIEKEYAYYRANYKTEELIHIKKTTF